MSQSGLLKILDLAKTAPAESKLDEISLLLAIKGKSRDHFISTPDPICISVPGVEHEELRVQSKHQVPVC